MLWHLAPVTCGLSPDWFHVKHVSSSEDDLDRIGRWLDVEWSHDQRAKLHRFERWLLDEAIVAGGIGPGEEQRIFDRHIADSLAFLMLIDTHAETLVDVGSGVGLPAIPIAIARPEMAVTMVDRSERRIHLARRALRILGLQNVRTLASDVAQVEEVFAVSTFRASLPIATATEAFGRLTEADGEGIFAWSRLEDPKSPPEAPSGTIFTLACRGVGVLDSPAWFLRIQRNKHDRS